MLKETITYTDFNGVERTEDFYFNFTKAEVTMMELTHSGGLVQHLQKIIAEQDANKLITIWKKIITDAYGEKSPDGKRFIKSEELTTAFTQTEAFSDLFMSLSTDAEKAAAFINGIIPQPKK